MKSTAPKQLKLTGQPEARHAQIMASLEYANIVRRNRANALKDLKAGKITLEDVLHTDCCSTATIYKVITSVANWGPGRTRRLLTRLRISEMHQLGTLTERQQKILIDE